MGGMIFQAIYEAAQRGELILIDGGYCRFHLVTRGKRSGQITLYEIVATRKGAGREMLDRLKLVEGASSIFAKCPVELASNGWYRAMGFELESTEESRSGNRINHWRLAL